MLLAGQVLFNLTLDTLLALTLMAMWQPQVVCGLIDLVLNGLFTPTSSPETQVVTATLRLLLLLASSPAFSVAGYQGARSQITVFCFELLHPLQPAYFLKRIGNDVQLQLATLIVLAFQASSHDSSSDFLRCCKHTHWVSKLGMVLFVTLFLPAVLKVANRCVLTCHTCMQARNCKNRELICSYQMVLSLPSCAWSHCRQQQLACCHTVQCHYLQSCCSHMSSLTTMCQARSCQP